jgi:hypothetical protein
MRRWTAILLLLAPSLAFAQGASDRDIQDALDRLTSQRDTPGYQARPTRRVRLSVPPVDVPAHVELSRERFPESAHNVTVNGGNLIRDGKPVFLIGVEAELYNGAWLHRILGIDFSQATVAGSAAYRSAIEAVEKRGADDAVLLELVAERDDPWLETRIREVLRGGTLFTCDFAVTKRSFSPVDYRRYRVDPPLYVPGVSGFHKTSSHFLDLSQENPQGREIYHNMLRWFGRSARKYPVFLYELVNEVSYISPTPANIRAFHVQMRKKYGTVEQANAAWGAKFDAFAAVIPPINIDSSGIYNSKSGVIPYGDALSVPLWIDWLRFMETRAVEVFRDLAATQRKVDPRARTTFQTPYWTGTHAQ